ncbi:MAG: hypothetical protein P3X22_002995 [Thermoprotei archaeon]|nr:hypothetical protein [Thermoprotei archaeon]
MAACRLSVVKLGGAAITVKSGHEAIDWGNLKLAASHLSQYRSRGGLLVVVHGGGSFGHKTVVDILRSKGSLDPGDSSVIQESMLRLALEVVRTLKDYSLKPTLHPPHSICPGGRVESCSLTVIERDLRLGLTPVTYGDSIPEEGGSAIISGDDLAADIAVKLKADCLVFAIRAPGVLDVEGRVIPLVSSLDQVKVFEAGGFDVTGGIRRKVESALKASGAVDNVRIVGLESLLEALLGGSAGTRVKRI